MATEFYPARPLRFEDALGRIEAQPSGLIVDHSDYGYGEGMTLSTDAVNYVHVCRDRDGNTSVTRYGRNDPEPVLRVLDRLFGVRFGPEHERTS